MSVEMTSGMKARMTRRRPGRLTAEAIVDAAVTIAARSEPDGLTGRALGEELGVDRSAVWRHFADRDALLLAVGDRLLQMAVAKVPVDVGPQRQLNALARSVVEMYVAHPYVGAAIACRTTRGPGELAAVEMMLNLLEKAGLSDDDIPRYQRALGDMMLAYAGMRAAYAILPHPVREAELQAWAGAYTTVSSERYPAIKTHWARLVGQDLAAVFSTMLDALWLAIRATADANQTRE